jgi:replication factor C subunit 1
MQSSSRDLSLGLWDVLPQLFSPASYARSSLQDKINLHFVDQSLIPLMVQENYLKSAPEQARGSGGPNQEQVRTLEMMANAAESIAEADLVDSILRSTQDWGLAPLHGVLATVTPAFYMQGRRTEMDSFPAYVTIVRTARISRFRLYSTIKQCSTHDTALCRLH